MGLKSVCLSPQAAEMGRALLSALQYILDLRLVRWGQHQGREGGRSFYRQLVEAALDTGSYGAGRQQRSSEEGDRVTCKTKPYIPIIRKRTSNPVSPPWLGQRWESRFLIIFHREAQEA